MPSNWFKGWIGGGPRNVTLSPIQPTVEDLPAIVRGDTYAKNLPIPAISGGTLALVAKQQPYAKSRPNSRADVWIEETGGLMRINRTAPGEGQTGSLELNGTVLTVRLSAAATAALSDTYPFAFEVQWTYGKVVQTIHRGLWPIEGDVATTMV